MPGQPTNDQKANRVHVPSVVIECRGDCCCPSIVRALRNAGIEVYGACAVDPPAAAPRLHVESALSDTQRDRLQTLWNRGTVAGAAKTARISAKAMEHCLEGIRTKLHVPSTLEAVIFAAKNGLIRIGEISPEKNG